MMKNRFFILINMFGISIAIGCCIVAYINWNFNSKWDYLHSNASKIYRIQCRAEEQGKPIRFATAPIPLANHIKQNINGIDKVVRFIPRMGDFRIQDNMFNTGVAYADESFFELFTFDLIYGHPKDLGDKSKIFISDELAKIYFDREDVVGQSVTQIINGFPKQFFVGGVYKKQPLNSSFYSESITHMDNYWETVTNDLDQSEDNWRGWIILFVQVDDPALISIINRQLTNYLEPQNLARAEMKVKEYYLENFSGMAFRNNEYPKVRNEWLRGGLPEEVVTIPNVMATLLLLLVCFNFTNTSIAISSGRLKEIGVRKVMGGHRRQLVIQFMGENLLLCFGGFLMGLLLAEWLVPAYDSMWPWLDLNLSYSKNFGFLAFLLVLLLTVGVLAGSYPAFYITSFSPSNILKGKQKFGGTNWFTRTLLGLQFSISLLAVIFAVAFYENAVYQKNYDLGFATNGIISVPISSESDFTNYRNALASNKGILNIAGTKNHIADYTYYSRSVKYESKELEVDIMEIGDNYFETMNIKLLNGRNFIPESKLDLSNSAIVTEKFAEAFVLSDDPIGKRIVLQDTVQLYIIGIAKDVNARGLWQAVKPMVLRYTLADRYQQMLVSVTPTDLKAINDFMKEKWNEVFPNTVYNGQMINQEKAQTLQINSNIVKMCSFLGFFSMLLCATGLYTMVSLNIIKKMKEIGIRKVLGASGANISRIINFEFMIILATAGLIGGGLGYWTTNMIMDGWWEYYQKLDALTFTISMLFMFLISALAVSSKTISATAMDPVKILRYD